MTKDVIALAPAWGYLQVAVTNLQDEEFLRPADAATARASLKKDFDAVFDEVKGAHYDIARAKLAAISADADKVLNPKAAQAVKTAVASAANFAGRGIARKAQGL
jgi:hypothetical protein